MNGGSVDRGLSADTVARSHNPTWARYLSRKAQVFLDVVVLATSFVLANLLRFDFQIPSDHLTHAVAQLPFVVVVQYAALRMAGVYRFVWRYIGMAELRAFLIAAAYSTAPILFFRFFLPVSLQAWRVPRGIILMDAVLAFGGVVAIRVLRRSLYERYEKSRERTPSVPRGSKRVLLIGAGRAGWMAVREILGRTDTALEIHGFVDDDPNMQDALINGVKVLGSTDELPRLVKDHAIEQVVITIARAGGRDIRRIVQICERIPVKVRIIPRLYEILDGSVSVSRIRDVQIEDLLGRESVRLDQEALHSFLANKCIMVTGAGGSIGSELARQVARLEPSCLLLVERAEFSLFEIDRELRNLRPGLQSVPLIADVGDRARMRQIMETYGPRVVIHAAAHKQVPMMESNPSEAIKNNVLGTRILAEVSSEAGVDAFILISTDKAVRPSSVMGASKRLAELVVQEIDARSETRFVAVRFGNVMGSAGSVIPVFREQIASGGPVTVTHPEMTRYFMTIPEASQLVLQAGAMGEGGEIFVLDMGQPVRILELAQDMIRLSGLDPAEDIEIVFTGVRPGEKLFEELQTSGESISKTRHSKIFIGKLTRYPTSQLADALERLERLSHDGNGRAVYLCLAELLPEAELEYSLGERWIGEDTSTFLPVPGGAAHHRSP